MESKTSCDRCITPLLLNQMPYAIIMNNNNYEAHHAFSGFLSFMEQHVNNGIRPVKESKDGIRLIIKEDLGSILGTNSLADTFLEIQNEIANSTEIKEAETISDLKDYLIKIINNINFATNNSEDDELYPIKSKLVLMKLLTFGTALYKDMEFFELFWKTINSEQDQLKLLNLLLDTLYSEALDLSRKEFEYEQKKQQNEGADPNTDLSKIKNQRKHSIILEPTFLIDLLDYIFITPAREKGSIKGKNLIRNKNGLKSFLKLAAVLPRKEIKVLLEQADQTNVKKLDKNEKKNVLAMREKRRDIMRLLKDALSLVQLNEIAVNNRTTMPSDNPLSEYIAKINKGEGFYRDYVDFTKEESESNFWVHIGSKIFNRLQECGEDAIKTFWKAMGNICYATGYMSGIDITISNEDDEAHFRLQENEGVKMVAFSKYAFWDLDADCDISLGTVNICHSELKYHATLPDCQVPSISFSDPSISDDFLQVDTIIDDGTWMKTVLSTGTRLNNFLPPGKYKKRYLFDKMENNKDEFCKFLDEIVYLGVDSLIINFTRVNSSNLGNEGSGLIKEELMTKIVKAFKTKLSKGDSFGHRKITFIMNEDNFELFLAGQSQSQHKGHLAKKYKRG